MKQLYIFLLTLLSLHSFGQAGTLVGTFGTGGKVQTSFSSSGDRALALAVQSDGKLVAGGYSLFGTNQDFAVARYTANGSLDVSFSGDGKQTTAVGSGNDIINGIALQANGKIVAVGEARSSSNTDIAVVRYNADGTLDATFSGDGKLTTAIGTGDDVAYAVAVQNDGKIVVAGYTYTPSGLDFAVLRYLSDGTLDASFSGDDIATVDYSTTTDIAHALALQSDGKIVVGGSNNQSFMLVRLNSDGTLDTGFDTDGKLVTAIDGSQIASVTSLAIQADGKIVAAGERSYYDWLWDQTSDDAAVARYTSNGQLDNTFNGTGKLILDLGSYYDRLQSVALQNDGKMLLGGSMNSDFAIVRLTVGGVLDTGFDGDGKVFTNFGTGASVSAVKLSGSRIYAAGQAGSFFGLAAYQNDAVPLPVSLAYFGGATQNNTVHLTWHTASEQNTAYFEVERSVDGRTFASLGSVRAIGMSNSGEQYRYVDIQPQSAANHYRLKMVDSDGMVTYSRVVTVTFMHPANLDVYPNPAWDVINVEYSITDSRELQIQDAAGRIVKTVNVSGAGRMVTAINISELQGGIYFVKASEGIVRFVKK